MRNKGFTLIELLVVVLIIGILAAIAFPKYQVAVVKTRFASMQHMVKTLGDSAERTFLATGSYPANWEQMDVLPSSDFTGQYNAQHYLYGPNFYIDLYDGTNKNIVAYLGRNATRKIGYAVWLKHDTGPRRGRQECWAYPDDDIANKVCIAVGGIKNGTTGATGVAGWNRYDLNH